jgi:hypothetical protein
LTLVTSILILFLYNINIRSCMFDSTPPSRSKSLQHVVIVTSSHHPSITLHHIRPFVVVSTFQIARALANYFLYGQVDSIVVVCGGHVVGPIILRTPQSVCVCVVGALIDASLSLSLSMYIFIFLDYVCMCIFKTHMCARLRTHACANIHAHTCIYIYIYIHIYVCVCVTYTKCVCAHVYNMQTGIHRTFV